MAAARGFTLLELVIALLLVAVMMPLLFNSLRLGARTWDSLEERTRDTHDLHLAALFLKQLIEQAQPFAPDARGEARISFAGEPHALRFVAPLPAPLGTGGMHWFTLEVVAGDDGKQLVLSHELYQGEDWDRFAPAPPDSVVLAHGLSEAQLDYLEAPDALGVSLWAARSDDERQLPQLVRLRLAAGEGSNARRYELLAAPKMAASRAGE
jgi:general secretion pathway protein J